MASPPNTEEPSPCVAAATTSGNVHVFSSGSSQVVRGVIKDVVPIITTVIDFGVCMLQGDSALDAGVKSVTHTLIGFGAAKIGMAIGSGLGSAAGPLGTVVGGVAGCLIGTLGNIVFDAIYDRIRG